MTALSFIAGMGAGALLCTLVILVTIRLLVVDKNSDREKFQTDTLNEMKQRNTLLAAQNAIFAALAKEAKYP